MAHIQSGLSQLGNLHAFAANNTNAVWAPATTHAEVWAILILPSFEMVLSPELLKHCEQHGCFGPPPDNLKLDVPVKWDSWGFVLTGGEVFYQPILLYEYVGAPNWTQTWKSLKLFSTNPHLQRNGYLLVSCAKHWFLQFLIVYIYLFFE